MGKIIIEYIILKSLYIINTAAISLVVESGIYMISQVVCLHVILEALKVILSIMFCNILNNIFIHLQYVNKIV